MDGDAVQQTLFVSRCRGMFLRSLSQNVSLESSFPAFFTASVTGMSSSDVTNKSREVDMAKREQRSNREAKKPKKQKIKVIAAAPSQKGAGWQPTLGSGKKK
jgi:hypothetical protein